ncbi:MAG TPA: hypothetical protein VFH73_28560 [Polyangia bacterium]|nr:hypothetical protein [Polyangia bacterium]
MVGAEPFPAGSNSDKLWQGKARALLARAIERHGGWAAWRTFAGVVLRPVRLSGLLPTVKGLGRTFVLPGRIEVRPCDGVTTLRDYPEPGRHGVFERGQVTLFDRVGRPTVQLANPRPTFRWLRKYRRWSPVDALYFFGYAMAHYHALPFTLVDARPRRVVRARVRGRLVDGVEVALPRDLHTHSRVQTFYFDDGLLVRHDYVADIVGAWARGAHFWEDFVTIRGLPIARRRHVVARFGRFTTPLVALHAEFADVTAQ